MNNKILSLKDLPSSYHNPHYLNSIESIIDSSTKHMLDRYYQNNNSKENIEYKYYEYNNIDYNSRSHNNININSNSISGNNNHNTTVNAKNINDNSNTLSQLT